MFGRAGFRSANRPSYRIVRCSGRIRPPRGRLDDCSFFENRMACSPHYRSCAAMEQAAAAFGRGRGQEATTEDGRMFAGFGRTSERSRDSCGLRDAGPRTIAPLHHGTTAALLEASSTPISATLKLGRIGD